MKKLGAKDTGNKTANDPLSAPLLAQGLEKTQISKYHTSGST